MKYLVSILAWISVVGIVKADVDANNWERIGASTNGVYVLYVDRSTIKLDNGIARLWTLVDYIEPYKSIEGIAVWSTKSLYFYNCLEGKKATVAMYGQNRPMGKGASVFGFELESKEFEWEYVATDTLEYKALAIACSGK